MAMAGISTACVFRCGALGTALAGNEKSNSKFQRQEKAPSDGGNQLYLRKVGRGRWSVCGRVYYNANVFRSCTKETKQRLCVPPSPPSPSFFSPHSSSSSPSPSPSSSSSFSRASSSTSQAGKVGRLWKRNTASFVSSSASSPSSSSWPSSSSSSASSCYWSWSSASSSSSSPSPSSSSPSPRAISRWRRVRGDEAWPAGDGGIVGPAGAASPSAADSVLTDVECIESGMVVGEVEVVGEPLGGGGQLNLNEEPSDVGDSSSVRASGAGGIDYQRDYFTAANRRRSQGTIAVHAGERAGRPDISDSLTTPLVQTATYTFRNTAEVIAYQEGQHTSYEYGRYGNPTTRVLEKKISALEGAEDTLVFASGMCAATTMLFALVPKNGHMVTTTDCYRRTRQFIQTFLHKLGITTTVIDPADMSALERALHENQVSLFFSESPTNPYLRCIDVQRVAELCHNKGALVCIDGTFATPVNQRSIPLGADIVIHSGTKYLAGHNDVLAGSLSGTAELVGQVRCLHNILGGVIDPHAAYLILRGIKTLELRVRRQNESAMRIARELENHPKILRVHYPGLESHPEHGIAVRQMDGFGGVVSFEINGDLKKTSQFIDNLKLPYIAPSLGGVESLVEQPTVISYWDQSPMERARLGIKDNLVRYSCGIECCDDILQDILQSLDSL